MTTLSVAYLNVCLYEPLHTRTNDCAVNLSRRRPDILSCLRFNSPPKISNLRESSPLSDLSLEITSPIDFNVSFVLLATIHCVLFAL
jgi:hypothetical protein